MAHMLNNGDAYRRLADEAAQRAADTSLPNVKERNLSAEKAWLVMAGRADEFQRNSELVRAMKAVRDSRN